MNDQTKDQIASVMLQHGTPEQQKEALLYCGNITTMNVCAARVESGAPSAYRLRKLKAFEDNTNGPVVLQGCFTWQQGFDGGFEWRDLPTIEE